MKLKYITSWSICWRTSSQLSDKANPTLFSVQERPSLLTLSLEPNKSSKHLKATISLVTFAKSSGISGAVSIKSG